MPMLWIHIKGMCHTSALPWHPEDGITPQILPLFPFFCCECFCIYACMHVCVSACISINVKLQQFYSIHAPGCVCESVWVWAFRIGEKVVKERRQRGHCLLRESVAAMWERDWRKKRVVTCCLLLIASVRSFISWIHLFFMRFYSTIIN